MKFAALLLIVLLLSGLSCTHTEKAPPKAEIELESAKSILLGKDCKELSQLSGSESFAKDLAFYFELKEPCELETEENDLVTRIKALPTWLRGLATREALKSSRLKQNSTRLELLSDILESTESGVSKSDKDTFAKEALGLASTDLGRSRMETRVWKVAPRLVPHLAQTLEDWVKVAMDFQSDLDFLSARRVLEEQLKKGDNSPREKFVLLKALVRNRKLADDKKGERIFASRLEEHVKRSIENGHLKDVHFETLMSEVRRQWTREATQKALDSLKSLEDHLVKQEANSLLGQIHWIRAKIFESEDPFGEEKLRSAIAELKRAANNPDFQKEFPDRHYDVHFLLGWCFQKLKDSKSAAESYKQSIESFELANPKDPFFAKGHYWYARALEAQSANQAKGIFEKIIKNEPFSYYALLSWRALQKPIPAFKLSSGPTHQGSKPSETFYLSELLTSLKDPELLELFVEFELISKEGLRPEQLSLVSKMGGSHLKVFVAIQKQEPSQRAKLFLEHPELFLPLDFRSQILLESERKGLPAELVFGLIRQESAFQTKARSPANAFGLMQVLYPVALALSSQKKARPISNWSDLYSPETNLDHGTALLSDLLRKFKGSYIQAIGSYNGSEQAMRKWLRVRWLPRPQKDATEFIEEIPYLETQNYIKLVLRNMAFYRGLLSAEPLLFPEEYLNMNL